MNKHITFEGTMRKQHLFGFEIKRFLDLKKWKILEIGPEMEIELQLKCPCCLRLLQTICSLINKKTSFYLRIGCCEGCGYVGYIDRPTRKWFINFYSDIWDSSKNGKQIVIKKTIPMSSKMFKLATSLPLNKNNNILDIGCGYGGLLKDFQEAGFNRVVGIESSKHRAEIAEKIRGLKILYGSFEDSSVQRLLKSSDPFALILSSHVLEHTYNPDEIIHKAAELQREGGYLILSLPNFIREPAMAVLMFLPHLHSFTLTAIEHLLAKNSYVITDSSLTTDREIVIVAKKMSQFNYTPRKRKDFLSIAIKKFKIELSLKEYSQHFDRVLWWYKKDNRITHQARIYFADFVPLALLRFICKLIYTLKNRHSILVKDLEKKFFSSRTSPLEIHFNNRVVLFYK